MSTPANTNKENSRNIGRYFKGVKSELKKVNWPNRKELTNHTTIVIVVSLAAAALLWVLDTTFGFGLNFIIK
ncbi:preprotein translocase subunit SecE [Alkaliphilus serpentinus]|uniref:Protein translocase subunit SecE n=1 Tax=Alkaliphilus serpentinus TaxID=1482731 RepID=A0A833M673_9FIRM|nr:preprotein translocase subunit SecE [Alkaliphilus serpentinus]KAB3526721.1 preprotein translocase subunit SecE [Alkaliphilus serpentinus]